MGILLGRCKSRMGNFLMCLALGSAMLCPSLGIVLQADIESTPLTTDESTMNKKERTARQKLSGISQNHIFTYWDELDELQKGLLLDQIEQLDLSAFDWQRQTLTQASQCSLSGIDPFLDFTRSGDLADIEQGRQLIEQGKVGCIMVAGGQGTRLRFDGPKGKYPISVIKGKTLFQIFAEKVLAAGKQAGKRLQLAIMTSPQNHQETVQFFADNDNFGLSPLQLSFFCQGTLPLLDVQGNLFLEDKFSISSGADGNGSCLQAFVEAGIWDKWKNAGIEWVNFILVDNPLGDPFDANLIGNHALHGSAITVKCVEKKAPEEKVGLLVKKDGRVEIVEYSEMAEAEKSARLADGSLKHSCANISLFCFGMDFIYEAASSTGRMPLHLAFKAVKMLNEQGVGVKPVQPNAYKFERFIFDVFPFTSEIRALVYPRELCFAPLKNFDGSDSPATVRCALQRADQIILEGLTGQPAPSWPFELSQDFYYPTPAFRQRWQGCLPPEESYLDDGAIPRGT